MIGLEMLGLTNTMAKKILPLPVYHPRSFYAFMHVEGNGFSPLVYYI